jgi:glutamine amidotransferase
MCQLLGMNCNVPTDICFSFTGFQARGGATDVHSDGWGIAFFEGRGTRLFLDPQPSYLSPVAELVRQYPIRSTNVVAHIRKATQGAIGLENTHPFMRELWGRYWIFAHNGNLVDFAPALDGSFVPVGLTDSEHAFCWLLQELRRRFGAVAPAGDSLFEAVHELTLAIAGHGEFNFLLSNGDWLFAHASTRLAYVIRQAPFAEAHLKDQDVSVDFSEVTTPEDRVAVIATLPLTDNETWTTMPAGTLWWFADGAPARTLETLPGPVRAPAT